MAIRSTAATQKAAKNRYYGASGFSSIKAFFGNYVNFTGRSTRAEYWWVTLFGFIASILVGFSFVAALIGVIANGSVPKSPSIGWLIATFGIGLLVYLAVMLLILLPSFALVIRRFRDAGFPWWVWLALWALNLVVMLVFGYNSNPSTTVSLLVNLAILVITCLPSKPLPTD
ncbi:DUF805 domain-containing protein [Lacticaseibacillus daqingensis]|uniref:DUF805 domain-containing protein n=1 Tax=Lacticaseibacillus daqingensis TaxID=2486014 RepID=UPI000F76FE03|nr:DUF805 domain-containing protein [Lacticaseibacillus daqingensis]